ncbi:MAG TPA: hypothetical protein VGP24_09300 [Glaciihabitans sp.]|jgi:hypothetical protein|nr:hypothetical protein [Glaciihabitans sp.]
MWLFGKNRETVKVKKIAAGRAVYQGVDTTQTEIEIKLITTDKERLTILVPLQQAMHLIRDLNISYQAAVPPLHTGRYESQWQGMDDNS